MTMLFGGVSVVASQATRQMDFCCPDIFRGNVEMDEVLFIGACMCGLAYVAVASRGWSISSLVRFLFSAYLFLQAMDMESWVAPPLLHAVGLQLVIFLLYLASTLLISDWSFRELRDISPALICAALPGWGLFFWAFTVAGMSGSTVRAWSQSDQRLSTPRVFMLAAWCAMTLTLVDVFICTVVEPRIPWAGWLWLEKAGPLSVEAIWLVLVSNVGFFFAAAAVLLVAGSISPRTANRQLAIFSMLSLMTCGFLSHLEEATFTGVSRFFLLFGLLVASRRMADASPRALYPWNMPRLLSSASLAEFLVIFTMAAHLSHARAPRDGELLVEGDASRPNVIVIVLDTVRADSLSILGCPRVTTPLLDSRVKRDGIVFDRAFAPAPWTVPTHASLVTGMSVRRHGTGLASGYISGELPSIVDELARAGYDTAGFIGNIDNLGIHSGFPKGFQHFEVTLPPWKRAMKRSLMARSPLLVALGAHRVTAEDLRTSFFRWLPDQPRRPFFAFFNFFDAHEPYEIPDPRFDRFSSSSAKIPAHVFFNSSINDWGPTASVDEVEAARDVYLGSIAYLDHQLDEIFQELDRRGILDETYVFVTSDHGEQFGEHGLFVHSNSLYAQLISVPLLVLAPKKDRVVGRLEQPVGIVNVAATLADLAGLKDSKVGGFSLAPCWREGVLIEPPTNIPILANVVRLPPPHWRNSNTDIDSIIVDGFHYIHYQATGEEELFNIVEDPDEKHDLAKLSELEPLRIKFRSMLQNQIQAEESGHHGAPFNTASSEQPWLDCICCAKGRELVLRRPVFSVPGYFAPTANPREWRRNRLSP